MDSKWRWLSDKSWYWKGCVANSDLVHYVETELHDRAVADGVQTCIFVTKEQTDEVYFDLPGMVLAERSHLTVDVDGLTIRIPCQDWESVLAAVKLLQPRRSSDDQVTYYKLHGWRYCIVLSPEERAVLIGGMEAQREDADAAAEIDNRRFVEGIEKMPGAFSERAEAIKKSLSGNKDAN